ncbi:carboxypeptidase-like regulatory domain-containing protein [Confluentibacter sediminis]|uniref:carboxypeptidase-like regulatory domain-containing protein n=1 Tax=Confluentibacter sediminis TaxID=2219045 RepID=UPI000DAB8ABE|nr:carboxypeptidase-like regulatory domain-containing protein [Confluentibacter sediminis]
MKTYPFLKFRNHLLVTTIFILTIGLNTSFLVAQNSPNDLEQDVTYNQYKGQIIDNITKKPLAFANLSLVETNITTVTNTEGEFVLKVPIQINEGRIEISFLGYESKIISLKTLMETKNNITLEASATELGEVNIETLKNPRDLIIETLKKKGENYLDDQILMTAFYRETIKKRNKSVSLSEAIVNIYKASYTSSKKDDLKLYKSRKSTDYKKLDTLVLKLQGGPFNTIFLDIMKYPEYIFTEASLNNYNFNLDRSTKINNRLVYVINFEQNEYAEGSLYKGQLFMDAEKKILTSAIYSLNISNKKEAAKILVRKKPAHADVWPTDIAYRVDYLEKDNKWYYGYSNLLLEFKVNWDHKLFNSTYTLGCEMAVTDWEKNIDKDIPKFKERIHPSIIMNDEAMGFSDPDFWGAYNIIEPDKSIDSAIKKIQKQLKKAKANGTALTN